MKLPKFLKQIGSDNSGGTAIEYGLIASLVVIACVGALESMSNENTSIWANVRTKTVEAMQKTQ